MRIKMKHAGSFRKTRRFLRSGKTLSSNFRRILEKHGERGVNALRRATPKDEGITADSWSFKIEDTTLYFINSNVVDGFSVALGLQYGHGTRAGTYIQGVDYINPELTPIFDKILRELTEEVRRL